MPHRVQIAAHSGAFSSLGWLWGREHPKPCVCGWGVGTAVSYTCRDGAWSRWHLLAPEVTQWHQPWGFPQLCSPRAVFWGASGAFLALQGVPGTRGLDGIPGKPGLAGERGAPGAAGAAGPAGYPVSAPGPPRRTGIKDFAAAAPLGSSLKHLQEGREKGNWSVDSLPVGMCGVPGHPRPRLGAAKAPELGPSLSADVGCLFSGPGRSKRT